MQQRCVIPAALIRRQFSRDTASHVVLRLAARGFVNHSPTDTIGVSSEATLGSLALKSIADREKVETWLLVGDGVSWRA